MTIDHVNHCLSYLRSMTLCSADLTLEPVDEHTESGEMHRRYNTEDSTYTCADWNAAYAQMRHNHERWFGSNTTVFT
jgi:hypothetical protein